MVDELKAEMRKLENLIGCKGKVDVTSKSFTEELIRALDSKYGIDLQSSVRLHRLEFYHSLIENARKKQRKYVEVEEKFLLAERKRKRHGKEETEDEPEKKERLQKPDDVVSVQPKDIDEWKNLMTLSKIYYLLEHPNSEGLTWKRRTTKKKHISKFNDKDLIEWRVAQNFRLKGLEDWALSRSEARKLAEQSPYDFDDLLKDDESRELEDMFNILDTQKQKTHTVDVLEKALHSKRPFKFKDEGMEDWTESYSDDSDEPGAEDISDEVLEFKEEPDMKVGVYKVPSDEPSLDEEDTISEIFSSYKEITKYRRPIFEKMDKTEDMKKWFHLCRKAMEDGDYSSSVSESPRRHRIPQILVTTDEDQTVDSLAKKKEMEKTLSSSEIAEIEAVERAEDRDTIKGYQAFRRRMFPLLEDDEDGTSDQSETSSSEEVNDLESISRRESELTESRSRKKESPKKDNNSTDRGTISKREEEAFQSGMQAVLEKAHVAEDEIQAEAVASKETDEDSSQKPADLESQLRRESGVISIDASDSEDEDIEADLESLLRKESEMTRNDADRSENKVGTPRKDKNQVGSRDSITNPDEEAVKVEMKSILEKAKYVSQDEVESSKETDSLKGLESELKGKYITNKRENDRTEDEKEFKDVTSTVSKDAISKDHQETAESKIKSMVSVAKDQATGEQASEESDEFSSEETHDLVPLLRKSRKDKKQIKEINSPRKHQPDKNIKKS